METMSSDSPPANHDNLPTVVVSKSSAAKTTAGDSTGENGDGERPVREKLKKTSIAQMANGATPPREVAIEEETAEQAPNLAATQKEDTPMENGVDTGEKPSRPISKRPLLEAEEAGTLSPDTMNTSANGHARKKSKDERSMETSKQERETDILSLESSPDSMEEENEDETHEDAMDASIHNTKDIERISESVETTTPPNPESLDQEMKEVSSPRRKRSRDQFEIESQERDQKVAATEQSKLRRRSVELKHSSPTYEAEEVSSDTKSTELDNSDGEPASVKPDASPSKV